MKQLDDLGVNNLVVGIVRQDVQDWRNARRRLKKHPNNKTTEGIIIDCERFFRSAYFETLTNMNGKKFLEQLKDEEERREAK